MKGLFILGVLFYIIVDSAAAGILKIPLKKTIVVLLVSDLVWYITVVSITIGTKSIISDMKFVILIFAGIVILYTIISKKIFKTVTRI